MTRVARSSGGAAGGAGARAGDARALQLTSERRAPTTSDETPLKPALPAPPNLTLYSRAGCHLCAEALATIARLRPRLTRLTLTVIDIDGDARLHDAYFERIPVLELDGEELCEYSIDEDELLSALGGREARSLPDAGRGESPR